MESNNFKLGQKISFKEDNLPFKVVGMSENYIIATRKFNKKEDAGIIDYFIETGAFMTKKEAYNSCKDEVIYTIIDFKNNIRGRNDFIFNPYDYQDQNDIDRCLKDLESGEATTSKRNFLELNILN